MSNDAPARAADESTLNLQPTSAAGPRPYVGVEIGATTHPGRVRENNEDHFIVARLAKSLRVLRTSLAGEDPTQFADEEGYLMVVADGMGGAAAGEKASALAVRTVEAFVLETLKWFLHFEQEENLLLAELRKALERADRQVIREAQADSRLSGMGTTLTMAYSVCTDLFIVHAGDSRAYLYRGGELERLTSDHTLVQMLVDGGALTPEAARTHARRNVVTNVIGGPRAGVFAEIHKVQVADGDVLLLCTDGLTEPVDDPEIARALADRPRPEDAARHLQDLALARGGPDNVTVIVARYQVQ